MTRHNSRGLFVDVPVAVLSGLPPDGAPLFGTILGTTRGFGEAELARRYPGGREEYATAFRAATSRAVAEGFLPAEDADEIAAVAVAAYPA